MELCVSLVISCHIVTGAQTEIFSKKVLKKFGLKEEEVEKNGEN
jgi:hypothetical protein